MATLADQADHAPASPELRERRFYLGMAVAIALIVLAGFGGYIAAGISSFDAPWWVHVHAVSYMAWIVLFLNQNRLVVGGNLAAHRRMGWIMAGLALWMVLVGTALLQLSLAAGRAPPPVFTAAMLIVMDEINVLLFAALVLAGIRMRQRSDWHRRLMLSATVCIIAPAIGRVTVLTIGFSWTAIILFQLALLAAPMLFDLRERGRIHPALLWGAAAIAAMGLVVPPIAQTEAAAAFAKAVAEA